MTHPGNRPGPTLAGADPEGNHRACTILHPSASVAAERALLGAALLDAAAAAEVLAAITAADLELPRHRTILAAIAAAHEQAGDASPLAVAAILEQRHRIAEVGGTGTLLDLATEAADLAGRERIGEHARIVTEAAERRRLVAWAQEMAAAAARGDDLADLRQRWATAAAQQLEAKEAAAAQDWRQVAEEAPIAWVVDGVLPEAGLLVLAGDPKAGKTLVAIDMALRLAHGMTWFGRRARPASTLYVSGEGAGGIPGRLRAWAAAHPSERIAPQQYVAVHRQMPDLGTAAGLADLRRLLDDLRSRHGRAPDVIVLDTFARAAGSSDENDSAAVGAVVAALEGIRREYGCAVVILHHVRKASGDRRASRRTMHDLRGSSALAGAVDAVLVAEVTESGARMIHPAALRDGEDWPPIGYQIIGCPTDRTRPDGRTEVAPVVLPADVAQVAQPNAAAPTPAEAQVDGIVATVRRLGYPVAKETACTTHGGKQATTRAAFDLALGRGLIIRSGGTTRRPLYSAGGVAATPQTPRRDGTGSPAPSPSRDDKGRDGTGRDGIACAESAAAPAEPAAPAAPAPTRPPPPPLRPRPVVTVDASDTPQRRRARLAVAVALETGRPADAADAAAAVVAVLGDQPTDDALAELLAGVADPAKVRAALREVRECGPTAQQRHTQDNQHKDDS